MAARKTHDHMASWTTYHSVPNGSQKYQNTGHLRPVHSDADGPVPSEQNETNMVLQNRQRPMENLRDLAKGLREIESARSTLMERINDAIEENDSANRELSAEKKRLLQQNEDLSAEITRLQQDNREFADNIVRLQADTHFKISDEYFVKAWESLRYNISNWAFTHFRGYFKPSRSLPVDPYFEDLVRDPSAYLDSPDRRSLLVQSFVWRILEDRVLHRKAVLWAGEQRHSLRNLQEALEQGDTLVGASITVKPRDFNRWRALSTSILCPIADQTKVGEIAIAVARQMKDVLLPYATPIGKNQTELLGGLVEIVHEAISLSRDFDQQRARFKVYRVYGRDGESYNFWRDAVWIQTENGSGHGKADFFVELVVAPGLVRRGSPDGDNSDREEIIVKCVVESKKYHGTRKDSASRSELSRRPQPSGMTQSHIERRKAQTSTPGREGKYRGDQGQKILPDTPIEGESEAMMPLSPTVTDGSRPMSAGVSGAFVTEAEAHTSKDAFFDAEPDRGRDLSEGAENIESHPSLRTRNTPRNDMSPEPVGSSKKSRFQKAKGLFVRKNKDGEVGEQARIKIESLKQHRLPSLREKAHRRRAATASTEVVKDNRDEVARQAD